MAHLTMQQISRTKQVQEIINCACKSTHQMVQNISLVMGKVRCGCMRKTSREPRGGGVAALSSPSAEQISDLRVDNGPVMWKNTILTQGDTLRKMYLHTVLDTSQRTPAFSAILNIL